MVAEVRGGIRAALDKALGHPDAVRGNERDYKCPRCKRGHLHVDLKKGKSLCHQCGFKTGSMAVLFQKLNLDYDIKPFEPDALFDYLVDLFYTAPEPAVYEVEMPEGCKRLPTKPATRMARAVYDYLRSRNITNRMIRDLGVGYCDKGKYRGYAIFPVQIDKRRVTWTSRRVVGLGPKVLHAPGGLARLAVFNHNPSKGCKRLFIVEGPFDALALHGRLRSTDAAVALLGTELPQEKARIIAKLAADADEVIVVLDNDAYKKSVKIARKLQAVCECAVSVVYLPDARDPDEIELPELRRIIAKRKSADFMLETRMILKGK